MLTCHPPSEDSWVLCTSSWSVESFCSSIFSLCKASWRYCASLYSSWDWIVMPGVGVLNRLQWENVQRITLVTSHFIQIPLRLIFCPVLTIQFFVPFHLNPISSTVFCPIASTMFRPISSRVICPISSTGFGSILSIVFVPFGLQFLSYFAYSYLSHFIN